jgi:hypothetical protein
MKDNAEIKMLMLITFGFILERMSSKWLIKFITASHFSLDFR